MLAPILFLSLTVAVCSEYRQVHFHTIYLNERHVITATYHKKRKYLEVSSKKKKEFVRG